MRSIFASLALVLVAGVLAAQTRPELPGQVVISPKGKPEIEPAQPGTMAILKGIDPDRPGFIVFVPNQAQASKLLPAPKPSSKVETVNGVPSITIIGSGPKRKPDEPMLPGGNKPKVAEPEKVEDGKILRETYDVVLLNGRVVDPESGLDAIRNVGIKGARIAAQYFRSLAEYFANRAHLVLWYPAVRKGGYTLVAEATSPSTEVFRSSWQSQR